MVFNMKLPRFFLLSIHNHLVYGGFIKITNKNNPEIKDYFYLFARKATAASFSLPFGQEYTPIMVKIVLITIKIIP